MLAFAPLGPRLEKARRANPKRGFLSRQIYPPLCAHPLLSLERIFWAFFFYFKLLEMAI